MILQGTYFLQINPSSKFDYELVCLADSFRRIDVSEGRGEQMGSFEFNLPKWSS